MTDVRNLLFKTLIDHPSARIVTDVGASAFSGWGDLVNVIYHEDTNAIELIFN